MDRIIPSVNMGLSRISSETECKWPALLRFLLVVLEANVGLSVRITFRGSFNI